VAFVEQCGVIGQLVVEELKTARLQVWPFIHWYQACCPGRPFTPALLDEFAGVDKWDYAPTAYHPQCAKLP